MELFDKRHVFLETLCLLTSSVTCGFGTLAVLRTDTPSDVHLIGCSQPLRWGRRFLGWKVNEFASMVSAGAGPSPQCIPVGILRACRNPRVTCHRRLGVDGGRMFLQVATFQFTPMIGRRFFCFGLFWHVLDISVDRRLLHRLSGSALMQSESPAQGHAPGVVSRTGHHGGSYIIGLAFALVLTAASFWASSTPLVYARALPILIAVLAVAQMGVHVAFFLQVSSAPDQTNNFLALAFRCFHHRPGGVQDPCSSCRI